MIKSLEKCYNEYLGAGNRNSDYWFVAIEPSLDEPNQPFFNLITNSSEKEFINYLNGSFSDSVGNSQVYNNVYNILKELELFENISFNSKSKKVNFNIDGKALYTNLSFLKFPKLDSPLNPEIIRQYAKLFNDFNYQLLNEKYENFDRMSLYKFENNDWIKSRRENISKCLSNGSKKIVFILTKEYQKFASLLFDELNFQNELTKYSIANKWGNTKITFYDNSNIYVVLPNTRIPDAAIKKIHKIINELLLK